MLRGCLWVVGGLFSLLVLAAVLGEGSRDRGLAPPPLPAAETGNVIHQFAPPADFRGIKWGAALPSKAKLRATVFRGCARIVERELPSDTLPCSHSHIETDDMDLFGQTKNVPPIFGVRVSAQLLEWSEKRFWHSHIYIYNYTDAELTTLRAALVGRFGPPDRTSANARMDQWVWRSEKIQVVVLWNPVAKPSLDPGIPPQTSIELMMGKID
jgi:hypothetical protein